MRIISGCSTIEDCIRRYGTDARTCFVFPSRIAARVLVRRAVEGSPFADLAAHLTGPLIYSISADPVAAAKVLNEYAKADPKLVLKAGCYAGKVLDKAGVQALASIPSRDELLAKLLGVMKAPVAGFAVALGALAKQREGAAA